MSALRLVTLDGGSTWPPMAMGVRGGKRILAEVRYQAAGIHGGEPQWAPVDLLACDSGFGAGLNTGQQFSMPIARRYSGINRAFRPIRRRILKLVPVV
jgi:hypothetical protein